MERSDPLCVGAIENLTAVTPHVHQADVTKHAEVLGDRRLREAQRDNDVADGTLAGRKIVQDVRRRGSAMALKVSDVVEREASVDQIPIQEYVKPLVDCCSSGLAARDSLRPLTKCGGRTKSGSHRGRPLPIRLGYPPAVPGER